MRVRVNQRKEVDVIMDSVLKVRIDQLTIKCYDKLKESYKKANSDFFKKQRMGFWTGDTPVNIVMFKKRGNYLCLPRATMPRLDQILFANQGAFIALKDKRVEHPKIDVTTSLQLRGYQEDALDALLQYDHGIVRGPCGSGKTIIMLGLIARLRQPTLIVVNTKVLLQQWQKEIQKWFDYDPGIIGGGKFKIKDITIAMQQTVYRRSKEKWVKQFGCLIGDEIHHWAASTFMKTVEDIPAKYRFGVSASERRKDGMEFLIYDSFGPARHKIKKEQLIDCNQLVPVELSLIQTEFRNEELEDMVENKTPLDWNEMLGLLTTDDDRNTLICQKTREVLDENKQNRILILSDRVEHCCDLQMFLDDREIESGLMLGGGDNREDTQQTVQRLKNGKLRVGIGTKVADEGLDIPALTHVFVTCPILSNMHRLEQMVGRAARTHKNKESAFAYIFWDHYLFPGPRRIGETKKQYVHRKVNFMSKFRRLGKVKIGG